MRKITINNVYELITLYNNLKDKKLLKYYLDHRSQVMASKEDPRRELNFEGYREYILRNSRQNNLPRICKKFILKLPIWIQCKRYQLFYLLNRYNTSKGANDPITVEVSAKVYKDISMIGDEREQNKLIDMCNKLKYLVEIFIPIALIREQH